MPYQPTKKTLRQAQTATSEAPEIANDIATVRLAQEIELRFQWERDVLEECSERVFRKDRALLPRQRDALNEIVQRHQIA